VRRKLTFDELMAVPTDRPKEELLAAIREFQAVLAEASDIAKQICAAIKVFAGRAPTPEEKLVVYELFLKWQEANRPLMGDGDPTVH
jgi:hypothetical protein